MHKWIYLFLVNFAFYCLAVPAIASEIKIEKIQSANFLVLSDIHFDPYLSCTSIPCPLIQKLRQASSNQWPQILAEFDKTTPDYLQDTNYKLLTSTFAFTNKLTKQQGIQFVLILGDFLGHGYKKLYKKYSADYKLKGYHSFVRKTLEFLALEFHYAFPMVNVYAVVGNNDTYQSDYTSTPKGAFFKDTAVVWGGLIKNAEDRNSMQKEFSNAGYYAVDLPHQKNMRLIVLNSNLFSRKAKGKNLNQAIDAEFNWLHQELTGIKARKQKAFIAMHIPEEVAVYASPRIRLFTLFILWKPDYVHRFQKEMNHFSNNIAGVFASHLHSDWFKIEKAENGKEIPIIGVPSISPIFGNQPAFKLCAYTSQLQVINNLVTYAFSLNARGVWRIKYDYAKAHLKHCHDCSIVRN